MNKINIFCFGFGQVAEAFINALINRNINFKLGITSRKDTHQIEINNIKINSYENLPLNIWIKDVLFFSKRSVKNCEYFEK